jgi:predicted DNA-binding transcriptional regulator YafY
MKNVGMTGEIFMRSAPAKVIDPGAPDMGETIPVRFTADESVAFLIYDAYPPDAVELQPDGSLLVAARVPRGEWLAPYFLTLGAHAELLEPEWLREELKKTLQAMAERYAK